MATSSAKPKPLDPRAETLYAKCLELSNEATGPNSDIFNQSDLTALNVASDTPELLKLCQTLMDHNLFQVFMLDSLPCYRCRPREEAAKMSGMNDKELMVYNLIEGSSTTGIWTKTLAARANLHQTVLSKALKWLEGKGWVKQIKSVKYPKRKIYMLKGLEPTEEVTGGPWFTDGEMDVDLINSVSTLVEGYVKGKSWREGPKYKDPSAVTGQGSGEAAGDSGQKEKLLIKDPRFYGPVLSQNQRILLPYPPGYPDYPTASSVLDWLDQTGIIQEKEISITDMRHLCDVLVYDGRLERVGKRRIPKHAVARFRAAESNGLDGEGDGTEASSVEDEIPTKKRRVDKGKGKAAASPVPGSSTPNGRAKSRPSAQQQQQSEEEYEDMYRWVRRPDDESFTEGPGNGFSEAPCSRCPVFRLCEEGGPVDAKSCEYFGPWLRGEDSGGEIQAGA